MTAAVAPIEAPSFSTRLREITHGLITEMGSPDPQVIADAVLERLTSRQYRDALAVCLTDWVRTEMSSVARRGRAAARTRRLTTPDRVRDWYSHQLATSMSVGGTWKFLRDCTPADLHTAAAERYRKASETHAEGDRWTKVALFMEEHNRETVAQLDEDELKSLMEES